jgi:hypothetical protein
MSRRSEKFRRIGCGIGCGVLIILATLLVGYMVVISGGDFGH